MTKPNIHSSMLSDIDIKQYFGNEIDIYIDDKAGIVQFDLEKQLQLASIDLHFRHECKRFKNNLQGNLSYQRLRNHEYTMPFEVSGDEKLIIQPGEVIFTTTMETVVISNQFAGIITGRSSIARLGIMVHCCQEFINPGQKAPIALQITNLGKYPVELDVGVPICQLVLFKLSSPSSQGYYDMEKSKYKNESAPMPSQIYKENGDNNHDEMSSNNNAPNATRNKKFMQWVQKGLHFIMPFLPPTIMVLLINQALSVAKATSLADVFNILKNFKIGTVVLIIAIVIYLFGRKGDKK